MTIRQLTLSIALLAAMAPPAFAGIDLTWNACGAAGGDSAATLACGEPDSVVVLTGCFQIPKSVPRFYAMDAVIDIDAEAPELPPFWHLESGGCNRYGIVLSDALPRGCRDMATVWGPEGDASFSVITAYGPGFDNVRNRGRLIFTVTRASTDTTTLVAKRDYFAFQLQLFTDKAIENGGECAGCVTPVTLRLVSLTFYGLPEKPGDPEVPVVVTDPGRYGSCVRLNGGRRGGCGSIQKPAAEKGR